MLCPSCGVGVKLEIANSSPVYSVKHAIHQQYGFDIAHGFCPECNELIVLRRHGKYWQHSLDDEGSRELYPDTEEIIFPPVKRSRQVHAEVPARHKADFLEAIAVLEASPKASAALSRRLLQDIIHNHFNIKARTLADEIDQFVQQQGVPHTLSSQVDAIRIIGNFAAHPLKDTNTGEILDVEPGEADWLIGTIEALFDFAFVQPKKVDELRSKLNAKLAAAGKPPLK